MSKHGRGSILLPIVIVAAGAILLLNTLGIVKWSFWSQLGQLWPVLVIVAGFSLFWRNWRGT